MKVRFAVSPGGRRFEGTEIVTFAEEAERLGFDTIWLSDVPLGPLGDPVVSLAAIATRTSRLKLGTNLVPIGRNPMLLARELAQLDQLSGGRLLVTMVPGIDQPGERRALGFPSGDRGAAVETIMGLLRRWWDGGAVELHTDRYDFDAITVQPSPVQSPLELWLGGKGPRALARVARCGDGWLTANVTPDEAAAGRDTILAQAAALGRVIDQEHFGISVPYARSAISGPVEAALRARRDDGNLEDIVPVGADELVAVLKRHADNGLSKFVLRPIGDPAPDELAWLADIVLPLQT